MNVTFTVPGEPKGKARPRVVRQGAHTTTYTPRETVMYENLVRICYQQAAHGIRLSGPVRAMIIASFPVPKSTSKKNRLLALAQRLFCQKKPDVDNLAKIVLDSLNAIAYDDDKQVCVLYVEKRYGETPQVQVSLEEIVQ